MLTARWKAVRRAPEEKLTAFLELERAICIRLLTEPNNG